MYAHDLDQAAQQFIGIEPHIIAGRIRQHMEAATKAAREWEATRDSKHWISVRRESFLQDAAKRRLAVDFGTARGWKLSKRQFDLRTLAEGKQHSGSRDYYRSPSVGDYYDNFDHPYFYRRNRKAAAIAAHLYGYPHNKDACKKLAREFGLDFQVPDFPSWWYPGCTTFVLYIGPAGREIGQIGHDSVVAKPLAKSVSD